MTLAAFGLVLGVGYLIHIRIWPTRVCPHCLGKGETGPGPHALRTCRRCRGSKRVRRFLAPRP